MSEITMRKFVIISLVIFFVGLFTFWAYHQSNWFPEKERSKFTIKIYYQSGRVDVKTFNLPKSTRFWITSHGSRSSLTSVWYSNHKPFGREHGYLVMGVDDFEIINIE